MLERLQKLLDDLRVWCDQARGRRSEISRLTGVSRQAVTNWIAGRQEPTAEQVLKVQEFLASQTPPLRIVFDRSALNNRFDLLKASRLEELTRDGKVEVFHTTTFLDETLRMANSNRQGRSEQLKTEWPFLVSICNGGWFKPLLFGQPPILKAVCDEELESWEKDSKWPLVSDQVRQHSEAKVTRFLKGSGPLIELINAQPVYNQNWQIKTQNNRLRAQLRKESTLRDVPFAHYHHANFLEAGRLLILRPQFGQLQPLPSLDHPEAKFEAWRRAPASFPHFTAFVGFWIYSLYEAEINQNSPLDRNWQPDAEQLCFLADVDAIVSSDQRFMKQAFEALWQPSQKRFFTPEEFVAHLKQL